MGIWNWIGLYPRSYICSKIFDWILDWFNSHVLFNFYFLI